MDGSDETFVEIVEAILRRFCAQNDVAPISSVVLQAVAQQLATMIETRGLPVPLEGDELGSPGELPEAECAPLVETVLAEVTAPDRVILSAPARQLVKACFHREFRVCRDSFREVSKDGVCRRQQLERARVRVSGTHCIDCPYWTLLTSETHLEFLSQEWQRGGLADLKKHGEVFLPEDFRALRRWLHARARFRL